MIDGQFLSRSALVVISANTVLRLRQAFVKAGLRLFIVRSIYVDVVAPFIVAQVITTIG